MVRQFSDDYNQLSLELIEGILKTKGLQKESVTSTFQCLLWLFAKCKTPITTRVQIIYRYNTLLKQLSSGMSDALSTVLLLYQLVQPNSAILRSLTSQSIIQR